MNRLMHVLVLAALIAAAPSATAQKPIIYPAKAQSPQQQQKDEGECYVWARNTTGIDPAAVASAPPPQQAAPTGSAAKGAVRGAAGGALLGEAIDDNPGGGAAAGAVVGTARGARQGKQAQAQQQQQAQAKQQQTMNTYYRALGACMEGRGYTIK